MTTNHENSNFGKEILLIVDDDSWILHFLTATLEETQRKFYRLASATSIRQNWARFKDAEKIVIHWENEGRHGGATVEEILEVCPNYDISNQIIILTTNPQHEDVVYFSELGIKKILKLRHREDVLEVAANELKSHIENFFSKEANELAWQRLQFRLDRLPFKLTSDQIKPFEEALIKLNAGKKETARYLDALGAVEIRKGNCQKAEKLLLRALELNPNYYRSYHNLIEFYKHTGKLGSAYDLLQKLHILNKQNVSHLVKMGEINVLMKDDRKAEHHFNEALQRDKYCSKALNGLADIRFRQGDFAGSRDLISRSSLASRFASDLNKLGIEMVKQKRFEEALEHYTNAQYVVPHRLKGPMLFYNIGLCFLRWGKKEVAKEFLKLALIKEPNYKKAHLLLEKIGEAGSLQTMPKSARTEVNKSDP